jgi:hypothetical protein
MPARGHAAQSFSAPIGISAAGLREQLRNLGEAKRFVEDEIPAELHKLPRWSFAEALIDHALETGKRRDLRAAERQLRQALSNEHWLAEARVPVEGSPEGRAQGKPRSNGKRTH